MFCTSSFYYNMAVMMNIFQDDWIHLFQDFRQFVCLQLYHLVSHINALDFFGLSSMFVLCCAPPMGQCVEVILTQLMLPLNVIPAFCNFLVPSNNDCVCMCVCLLGSVTIILEGPSLRQVLSITIIRAPTQKHTLKARVFGCFFCTLKLESSCLRQTSVLNSVFRDIIFLFPKKMLSPSGTLVTRL